MEEELVTKKVKKTKKEIPEKEKNIIFDIIAFITFLLISIAVVDKSYQNDTFYTIKCGEFIFKNGVFGIGVDPFSWHSLPYTWPHWLYDLGVYIIYAISGKYWEQTLYVSTIIFTCILGIALYITSLKLNKKNRVVAWLTTLFAIYLLRSYIAARAQLITFILFVFEIFFIEKLLETNKKRYGFVLLAIALLITELHCAVYPMFFVFALPYLAEFVFIALSDLDLDEAIFRGVVNLLKKLTNSNERREKYNNLIDKSKKNVESRKIKREKRRKNPYKVIVEKKKGFMTLVIFLIIAIFVGFLNPMGTGAFTYTLKIYQGNTTNSINEHLPLTLADNIDFAIMVGVLLVMLILFDLKVNLSDLLMIGGTLILSFKSRRQVSLVIIMCMPILSKLIAAFFEKYDNSLCKIIKSCVTSIVGMLVTIGVVTLISNNLYSDVKDNAYVSNFTYPIIATDWLLEYMEENDIAKEDLHLYNEYNYGSYLLFRGLEVFIDSRCDLYTPEFNGSEDIFTDALSVPNLNSNYEEIFEKYDVRYLMIYTSDGVNNNLENDENYSKLYKDGVFTIYKRLNAD